MSYELKYLKYKNKYINLRKNLDNLNNDEFINQRGGWRLIRRRKKKYSVEAIDNEAYSNRDNKPQTGTIGMITNELYSPREIVKPPPPPPPRQPQRVLRAQRSPPPLPPPVLRELKPRSPPPEVTMSQKIINSRIEGATIAAERAFEASRSTDVQQNEISYSQTIEENFINLEIQREKLLSKEHLKKSKRESDYLVNQYKSGIELIREQLQDLPKEEDREYGKRLLVYINEIRGKEFDLRKYTQLAGPDDFNNQEAIIFNATELEEKVSRNGVNTMEKLPHDTASLSIIYRAHWNGKPCFMKSFVVEKQSQNEQLTFEAQIYKYIEFRNSQLDGEFSDNFINLLSFFKISIDELKKVLIDMDQYCTKYQAYCDREKNYYPFVYFMVTEDIEGQTLNDVYYYLFANFFLPETTLELKNKFRDELMKITFELVYGFYLLNERLNVIHNDNHFGNIIVKKTTPRRKKYTINKLEFEMVSEYIVKIYDFDNSFYPGDQNKTAEKYLVKDENKIYGRDLLNDIDKGRDIHTIGLSFLEMAKFYGYNYFDMRELFQTDEPYNILKLLFVNERGDERLLENFLNIYQYDYKTPFWSSYCYGTFRYDSRCNPINVDWISPEKVLRRILQNEEVVELLGINKVNPFFKKYLKYKNKYINLKVNLDNLDNLDKS